MQYSIVSVAGVLASLLASPALAGRSPVGTADVARSAAEAPARTDDESVAGNDVIVVGKSYGNNVGKTVTPLKDVPNTITVVDREQIEAQNLFTLEDALTATNGITVNGVGSESATFYSRGFAITNYLLDGVPTQQFAFPAVVPDLFTYDRLEVLRGPAGLFSGSGNPAGSINLVRKRPLPDNRIQTAISYGTYNNLRLEADLSGRLTDSVRARVGALAHDQDQFYDIAHRKRIAAFGVVAIDIGDRTTLTIGGSYDRFEPAIQTGLPGYAGGADGSEGRLLDVRRSTYLGADWNRFRSDTYDAYAELTHRISDRWTLRATGVWSKIDRIDIYSYIGSQPITTANAGLTNHIAYRGDTFASSRSFDFNGVGTFPMFGRDQTLILGVDYQAQSYDQYFTRLSNYARINVFNPVSPGEPGLNPYGPTNYQAVQGTNATCPATSVAIVPAPANCVLQVWGGSYAATEQYGMYGQLRLSPLAGVTLVGGGRLTWWDTTSQTLLPVAGPTVSYGIDARFTPYAGLVWDITDNLNLYGSYADSFSPTAPIAGRSRPDGLPLKPLVGAQYEAGTKLALMNRRLLLSLAAYDITQSNRTFSPTEEPTVVVQLGKVRSRGVEAEASGEILPGWRINGGYSYTKTKYLDNSAQSFAGLPLVPVTPEHMVKFFTNYKAPEGALAGASIGGGLTWFSETWGGNPTVYNANGTVRTISTVVRQKAYAVVDLRAGYDLNDQIGLSVNVNNLLDKTYYARVAATGRGNFYGSPRTVVATLRYRWQ